MMGWLITLGVLFLLAVLPLGVRAIYNADGFFAYLIAGPLRIKLFPAKKNRNKNKEKEKPSKKKTDGTSGKREKAGEEKSGGSVTDFLPLVNTALAFLNDFRRKLRVNTMELKLILAGGDPCDLAVNYGKAWTAVGNLMPQLERFLVIRKRDIQVECDFVSDKTLVFAKIDLTITLGRILCLAVYYGIRIVCGYIKIMNKRKGGVN